MDFKWHDRPSSQKHLIPNELIGLWEHLGRKYEFRADGRYYVLDLDIAYQLIDGGMTLVHSGTRYKRLFGDPAGLPGVWQLEEDPLEEWNLRDDGSYTYHWPGYEYFGDYTHDSTTMSTSEMRAVVSESAGSITFDPPYALSTTGQWTIVEPTLTITFPTGPVVYTRA
jgi:hypothetical protein